MSDGDRSAALQVLLSCARRAAVASHLQGGAEQALLQSIVDATVVLFDAEAASIALHEPATDRLVFRVAAGEQGAGALGISIPTSRGLAGYVFSTGQPLALSDVSADPRFDRATAERTGYVPRSIAAVPLVEREGSIGVLQVLDKRGSPTFSLRDMELLAVFAGQAATAIAASRVQHDLPALLRGALREVSDGELDEAAIEALVGVAAAGLDADDDTPFWRLAHEVARLRGLGERELTLVSEILATVARHVERAPRRGR